MARRIHTAVAALGLAALAACQTIEPEAAAADKVEQAPAARAVDPRDQYALLADIEKALGDSLARDAVAMAAVRSEWHERRIAWEVAVVPQLCRSHTACNVAPFDHLHRPERRIQQGWMPKLRLDEAGYQSLTSSCGERKLCIVRIEATIAEMVFDPELPTSLELGDISVLSARDPAPTESWLRSAPLRKRT
jgi:hypothetical protein